MRISLALIIASVLVATPAYAQDADASTSDPVSLPVIEEGDSGTEFSAEFSNTIETSWPYPRQLLTQSTRPAAEASLTGCVDEWCVSVWHASELSNHSNQETDLIGLRSVDLDNGYTIDVTGSIFLMPGENAVSVEVGITKKLDDHVSVRASYQGSRGGFVENSPQLEVPIAFDLVNHVRADVTPAVFYSDYAKAAGASIKAGIEIDVKKNFAFRLFSIGYVGGGHADMTFGLSVVKTF